MATVITVGNFNIDNVVSADGRVTRQQVGGNAIYAALGAHFWSPQVGIVSVIPQNYPTVWLDELTRVGFDLSGIRRAGPAVTRQEWFFYQPDGSRIDHLYAPTSGEPPTQSETRLTPAEVTRLQDWVATFAPETGVSFRQFRELNPLLGEDIRRLNAPIAAGHIAPNPSVMQLSLAQALRERGGLISLDPALDLAGQQRDARLAALLPLVDIFLPSQRELQALYPDLSLEAAILRLSKFGATVIGVKLGAQGSLIWDRRRDDFRHIPAYPAQVVDLTGAGDAFCGGFLAGMLATGDPWLAAGYGSVSASLIIEKPDMLTALHLDPTQAHERLRIYA
jgi:ribokinase